jgi:transporter family-2 protein
VTSSDVNRPVAGVALAALGGACLAVQSRLNGQLGAGLGDGVAAAVISFGLGMVFLTVLVPALPAGRRGLHALRSAFRDGTLRWWQCVGGVFGAYLVTTQGLTVGLLGVAVFTVAVVAGQVVSSLVVDRAGLGPAGSQPVTWLRLAGAALAVVAVVISVSGDLGRPAVLWLAVLPAVAGIGTAVQQAFNGQVRAHSGDAMVATLLNFGTGVVALLVAFAVEVSIRGFPRSAPTQWWVYVGGLLGILVIFTAATAVRMVGVLLVGLASVAGQLVGALAVDLVAPAPGAHLALTSVLGTALILVAVAVAALPTARR